MSKRNQEGVGNNRGHAINGKSSKDQRRKDAYARDEIRSRMSLLDKINALPSDGAARQRARYAVMLEKQKEKNKSESKQDNKKERTQQAAKQLVSQIHTRSVT